MDTPAQRQVRPDPRADLTDEAPANEQLVTDRLGVRRVVAKRWKEEL
jgi:hypothetical protein